MSGAGTTLTVDHGAPVDALLWMPSGGLLLSAGGPTIKVWDVVSGGRCLHSFSNHQKAITSLCLDGTGRRILSAGLDGHVKIYDSATYKVTHGLKYTAPLMSIAVSVDNRRLAVGMADGISSIRRREDRSGDDSQIHQRLTPVGGSQKHFKRGRHAQADSGSDFVVEKAKKIKLQDHDKMLKKFDYGGALDAALETRNVVTVCSLLEELEYRGGLRVALSCRDEAGLEPLMAFLVRYATAPRYARLLLRVCEMTVDLYAPVLGRSIEVDELFFKLLKRVEAECDLHRKLTPLRGQLDMLFHGSIA
jgi:U3 small nucleolar RNA-associated protein 15